MPSIVVVALGEPGVPVICWANAPDARDTHRRILDDDRKLVILLTTPSNNGRFRGGHTGSNAEDTFPPVEKLKRDHFADYALSAAPMKSPREYTIDMQDAVSSRTRSVSRSETVKQAYRGRDQHPSRFFRATRLICRTLFHLEPVP